MLTNCPLALSRLRMHVLHSKTAAPKTCRHDTECSDWKNLRRKMKHRCKTICVQAYEQNRTLASWEHRHLRFHKELPYSAQAWWCILTPYRCSDPMLQNQKRGTAPMLKDPVLGKRLGLTSMDSSFCPPLGRCKNRAVYRHWEILPLCALRPLSCFGTMCGSICGLFLELSARVRQGEG